MSHHVDEPCSCIDFRLGYRLSILFPTYLKGRFKSLSLLPESTTYQASPLMNFSRLPRHKLLDLISECTGETIWPVDHCRARGVPADWIDVLSDAFESNLDRDRDTIYFRERPTNQFHGVRDVDLAKVIASQLELQVQRIEEESLSRSDFVRRIYEAIEEG